MGKKRKNNTNNHNTNNNNGNKKLSKKKQKQRAQEQKRFQEALHSFNRVFAAQYSPERWHDHLLPALRRPPRYACLINAYADPSFLSDTFTSAGIQDRLRQVPFLNIPCLEFRDWSPEIPTTEGQLFPHPEKDMANVSNYYLLDAASVLVTEALQLEPDDHVLDLCAAPGGKSVALMQRLRLRNDDEGDRRGRLVCNEIGPQRKLRLRRVMDNFCPASLNNGARERIEVQGRDGTRWHLNEHDDGEGAFDKVLVDAPCSSERHLLHDEDEFVKWTAFTTRKQAERQVALLKAAIRAVRPGGGMVVYATCSLRETENDGVVEKVCEDMKRKKRFQNKKWESNSHNNSNNNNNNNNSDNNDNNNNFDHNNNNNNKLPIEILRAKNGYKIGEPTRYGWIVLPDTSHGWGPLYFAVIKRIDEDVLL